MNKHTMLIIAPVQSQSGYGKHAVDVTRSIISLDKYDVKILSIKWGSTPMNALTLENDNDILSRIVELSDITKQPNIVVYITIPTEYMNRYPSGAYNIGITAGIESTLCAPTWIEGINRVDLNIVPSNHSKEIFEKTEYVKHDKKTNNPVGSLKIEKPIEVIFEGLDTNIFKRISEDRIPQTIKDELYNVKEDHCFLFVGHWLQGKLGHDRKDVGMLIKLFLETFKQIKNPPALILKSSAASFSILDREEILKKINDIKNYIGDVENLPNIYLLHGQLTDAEMNGLYNHPKIKSMISLTKGEGFGRPLLEFSMSGKPILASGWSGHLDFLDPEFTMLIPGKLETVDQSSVNDFIVKDSKWFVADYQIAGNAMIELYVNYHKYLTKAKKMMYKNKLSFSLDEMTKKFDHIFSKYIPNMPLELDIKLPISKTSLPKLANLPKLK